MSMELMGWLENNFNAHCHRVGTAASIVVRVGARVRVSGGSGGLKNTRITEGMQEAKSWFGLIDALRPAASDPYTQEHPKLGGYNRV